MLPTLLSFTMGCHSTGRSSKFIFFMFVFGTMLFCAGFVLSIFGFQTCQMNTFYTCSMTFKVMGPALSVIGLGLVLLARSKARLEQRRRELEGNQTDPDSFFLCGESRQFIQFLIFGFLFVTSGILISVLGVWIPGCNITSQNVNGTEISSRSCGFLSLQIMGPLVVLIGLCFFAVAHIKKKHNLADSNDSIDDDDDIQTPTDEPFHITVGDTVIVFPPPPPPYFAGTSSATPRQGCGTMPMNENPPSYSSIFFRRTRHEGRSSVRETIYTIPLPSHSADSNAFCPLDPPPKYEEKDPSKPDNEDPSSSEPDAPSQGSSHTH
ncbi:transmembrane 171 isoform X1 [Pelobates cultripes]|uniref:Transmembrane 171 isoform X1 n=1 Tax=Pelobates cultripes TaxID=61616 RepID=A0AAD1W8Y0_PELCU|nr:transmembrane 171 isoform X1 [Pelobates cultripes]